jgi:hypothetical protein
MPLLLAALLFLAAPADAAPDPSEDVDYRGFVDQARFQIRKEYWDQAERDLERAVAHPDGALDAEAWWMLAQVRLQLARVPEALEAAAQSLKHARTPEQTSQAAALVDQLRYQFGVVRIVGAQPGVRLRPDLDPDGALLDPSTEALVVRLEKRLRQERPVLPVTVGLPVGGWVINDDPVEVVPGETARVELGTVQAGGNLATARLAWLELSPGLAVDLSGEDHVFPSPDVQVALTVPVHRFWVVGLVGHWTPAALRTADGAWRYDPRQLSGGVRVGPLLDDAARFLVRPAVGYRFGTLAGIALPCSVETSPWSCGEGARDVVLYARGPAHILFAEVAADYLDRRRTSGLGAGVKVSLERAMGRLPAAGTATGRPSDDYTVAPSQRAFARTTLRILANLSIAF